MLQDTFVEALIEKKAAKIVRYDCENYPLLVDCVIICEATTSVHLRALKEAVESCYGSLKKEQLGELTCRASGDLESGWLIIDLNDFIIHIMLDSLREYYALDDWVSTYATLIRHESNGEGL